VLRDACRLDIGPADQRQRRASTGGRHRAACRQHRDMEGAGSGPCRGARRQRRRRRAGRPVGARRPGQGGLRVRHRGHSRVGGHPPPPAGSGSLRREPDDVGGGRLRSHHRRAVADRDGHARGSPAAAAVLQAGLADGGPVVRAPLRAGVSPGRVSPDPRGGRARRRRRRRGRRGHPPGSWGDGPAGGRRAAARPQPHSRGADGEPAHTVAARVDEL
ncbi:MAG: Uncharacterized protein conserved in bacteria, partial [uncultured Solirubrobacteraceae bacterium]